MGTIEQRERHRPRINPLHQNAGTPGPVLAASGFAHLTVSWNGDVLHLCGVPGVTLLFLRNVSNKIV